MMEGSWAATAGTREEPYQEATVKKKKKKRKQLLLIFFNLKKSQAICQHF